MMNLRSLFFAITCVLLGVAIGVLATQQEWHDWLYADILDVLISLVIASFVLGVAGALGYLLLRWWVKSKFGVKCDLSGEEVVVGLADRLTNREQLASPSAEDRTHSLMINLGLYYVRSIALQRYFLVIGGTFTALIGMATVFLLFEQNEKLEQQNAKLDQQTEQIKIQSQANTVTSLLMEGTRRAALSGEQSTLFALIRDEAERIRRDDNGKANRECNSYSMTLDPPSNCWRHVDYYIFDEQIELVHLSDVLSGRVLEYAQRAKAYPLSVKKDRKSIDIQAPLDRQFEFPVLSPERGQLLQTLLLNRVNVSGISFANAELSGLDLSNAYLEKLGPFDSVDLAGSNLRGANLWGVKMKGVILFRADLRNARIAEAELTRVNLRQADMRMAILLGANLEGADLRGANLSGANLEEANLTNAKLTGADITGAILNEANLYKANLQSLSGMPETNVGRQKALDDWLRSTLRHAFGLNKALLPKGITVLCTGEFGKAYEGEEGDVCPAEDGWTINYVDQKEFE